MARQDGRCNLLALRQSLEKLPVGAYMCDPNGLITYYNQQATKLWGGRRPRLNKPDDRFNGSFRLYSTNGAPLRRDQCWMALALRTRTEYSDREIIIERPDRRRLIILVNISLIRDKSGILLGAVSMLMDITERKEAAEEQYRLRSALAHMGRLGLAGEMAAGIAHEVNQPLTAIVNYSEACLNLLRSGQADTEMLIAAIAQVAEQGRRAGEIIRRLRSFIRKAPLRREPTELRALIDETIGFLAAEIKKGKIHLRLELAESLPQVTIDPIQIQQVLVNLMRNSLEAMSGPGIDQRELTIRAESAAGGEIMVTLCDTGPGFADGVRERLFDPFMTTMPQGMGLGLPLSKSIIEAHGGRLWAAPNAGAGATFHFTLPYDPPAGGIAAVCTAHRSAPLACRPCSRRRVAAGKKCYDCVAAVWRSGWSSWRISRMT
ncbi:MAG TPA: ATP-binding protein [Nitrococcus sp.]|nr:ATP-binding protein [Nitrococcus sp.]